MRPNWMHWDISHAVRLFCWIVMEKSFISAVNMFIFSTLGLFGKPSDKFFTNLYSTYIWRKHVPAFTFKYYFFFCLCTVNIFTTLHHNFGYMRYWRIIHFYREVYFQIKPIRTLRLRIWLIYVFTKIYIQILICNLYY